MFDFKVLMVWLTLAVTLALGLATATAYGAYGIASFDGQVTSDASGTPYTQAGGTPYAVSTEIRVDTIMKPFAPIGVPVPWPAEPPKDIVVDVPPGLVGNPTAAAECRLDQLVPPGLSGDSSITLCPASSQVGVVKVAWGFLAPVPLVRPVFNLVPPPNVPARFAFSAGGAIVTLDGSLRSGSDNGLTVSSHDISEGLPIIGTDLTLWGAPADPSHQSERACPGQSLPAALGGSGPWSEPASTVDGGCPTDAPLKSFLRLPTSCPTTSSQGEQTTMYSDSWYNAGRLTGDGRPDLSDPNWQRATFFSHLPPDFPDSGWPGVQQGTTGCDNVPFEPFLSARPSVPASPGASGYVFDLNLPQTDDPTLVGEADLKKAIVTLPEGVRVSPSSANGLGACSPVQIDLHSTADATCPDSSKIGSLSITTPLLEQPMQGSIYLATPHDNPSHSLLAVYLVAKGPGVIVKLAGNVASSSNANGQLTATFDDNPQLPFSNLHLEFFGGDHAALTNPQTCGTYTTTAALTGWNGQTVESDSQFTTSHDGHGAPCPAPGFEPTFDAGTADPVAGKSTSLSVTVARSDNDQEIGAIDSIAMPNGLLAKIGGVPLCRTAQSRMGTCGATSQIGAVTAEAGPGPDPFTVRGRVYLAGRYKTAPFSLSIVVPVIAGPFDLGTVVVRSAIYVDRHNATLKVATDPLPRMLQGIPLQVRTVNVLIDRRSFIRNPTSCAVKQIAGLIRSTGGLAAHVHDRFQVGECASLGFAPKMTVVVGGKGHTGKGASTPLTTTLTMPRGGANLRSVSVTLPDSLNARLGVVGNACTQAQFDAGHCQKAKAGTAVAVTPLLTHALRGGVYFVKDPKKRPGALPNLVVALRGQVAFDLVGAVKIPGGTQLATRFGSVPDVPVTKFVLRLVAGAAHGPLGNAANLCSSSAKRKTVALSFAGQNGKTVSVHPHLVVKGCR